MNKSDEPSRVPQPIPIQPNPFPYPRYKVSGLYSRSQPHRIYPRPIPGPVPDPYPWSISSPAQSPDQLNKPISRPVGADLSRWWFKREELRLDVDGIYPQMVVSGTAFSFLSVLVHWIADVTAVGPYSWAGNIWYKDGNTVSFPYTNISIRVSPYWFPGYRRATVNFSGGGAPDRKRTYRYTSPYFHTVEFEFDSVAGTAAVTSMNTGDHPNRPATLPTENLSIDDVYQRAGFNVRTSGGGVVPLVGAGANARWSDMEMHDAMQTYWSRFANAAQWSIWVFFASLHERGTSLGGIMFDDIGPNHRQGTSIFEDSFIADPPSGELNPDAWITRMRFWTAVHEMGHSFNLAHSWQKQHPASWGTPWIPLLNEPESRSFMNYPYNVSGGEIAFFSDFDFRFSDGELLFTRHAPARFVQPGNAEWFDNHGFQQANISPEPRFKLEVRVNRPKPEFEFLEPVQLEMKLTNTSSQPQLIPENIMSSPDKLTVIIKKSGKPARAYKSYAQYCMKTDIKVLMPGESVYESLSPYAGLNGMDMIEPGYYSIQAALQLPEDEDIVSNLLTVRVTPPLSYDEEYIAQDFFSDEVGRILGIGGSTFLTNGINTLHEVADRLKERKVAIHARVALTNPMMREYKSLAIPEGTYDRQPSRMIKGAKIKKISPNVERATQEMSIALIDRASVAAESLGHIRYRNATESFSSFLAEQGEFGEATRVQDSLYENLSKRNVLESVLKEVKEKSITYEQKITK